MSRLWGSTLQPSGETLFRLWAPGRETVTLDVDGLALEMESAEDGWFSALVEAPAGTRYRFRIDEQAVPDPASRSQSGGVHGWSLVTPAEAYPWVHDGWRGRPWTQAVIQEVHVGVAGGFTALIGQLPRLAALGITAIELMPIGAFGGMRNWGYDGVLPFAPAESYGSPDELKALIDAAHGHGLMVLLDVVYNHFGPDGNYLSLYAPDFFHADVDTPWGGAVAVDKPQVAAFFLENALMWLNDYRFDGLRFDAVHAIGNPSFLDWLAHSIRDNVDPERHVHLILENEENDAARLGPDGFDAQWNDDFHNVLHVLLTRESSAYYGDFADGPTERLARCLEQGFIYQGEPSPNHDGRPRGTPSGHLPPFRFVSFLQNHDQIGNRALGERLTQLVDPARLRAATALLLLCPQVPLLFMGDEIGARTPFLFFTDFHDKLADAVREGRRREFAKFEAFSDEAARARIPDPNSEATFAASRPERPADAEEWEDFYRTLLRLRAELIMPRLEKARAVGATMLGEGAVQAAWRLAEGVLLTIIINIGDSVVALPSPPGRLIHEEGRAGDPASFAAWWSAP
ncbi:malto-oligosyltrehalose trehalohydrolase [Sphingobium bisphenolivorans]|uniref:malto-oligosyltrehalose trehalohydrolase n=1 Tax=Sphingobium bisphenolivorans TaxID=1335760 RepID=UPI0003B5EBCF|nr:malto-oligosyltrehalose trehalohydrolase [Sphingobium bisphenolivorans]